ncbi:alpha/beta hydrolase [Streptomyces sp. NPDC046876]|uniref:alpha/beta fold hydrolase n=1 Tax=Streptomyces sp. NPDC046876 TaxID=3155616 RepID=UPI0033EC3641
MVSRPPHPVKPAPQRPMPQVEGAEHRLVPVRQDTDRAVLLHVAEWGSGDPVLLLHGFPQHWYAWREVAGLLAADHRVICADLRGFGWSEQTRRGYDAENLTADVLALLDALGLDRVHLIGHDWGGQVAFRLCLRAPQRVAGFLGLNAPHPWPPHRAVVPAMLRMWFTAFLEYPVIGPWVLRNRPGFTRFLLRRGLGRDAAAWDEAELAEYVAATRASDRAGQQLFWQYVLREIPALLRGAQRGERLTVPTVLLGGRADPVIPPSLLAGGERYADDLRLHIVPGAGHFLPHEQPALVADAARELFARTP